MNALEHDNATTARRMALTLLLSAATALACGAEPLQPPQPDPCSCAKSYVCCDSGLCAPDRAACAPMPPVGPPSELLADIAGTWTGRLETFTFASGSDAIAINIAAPPGGTASATVVFGDAPPPPPPRDPDVAWPAADVFPLMPGLEGYPYEARDLRWEAMHLSFTLSRWSPWQAWCALQTPYPSVNLGYSCVPAPLIYDNTGEYVHDAQGKCLASTTPPTPVDCAIGFPLCMSTPPICKCDATGCNAWDLPAVTFDIALADGVGDGITNVSDWSQDGNARVRLTQTTR